MATRDYHRGRIDALRQREHERRGNDRGLTAYITGRKCHYKPPRDRDARVHYRQGWSDQRRRR
jgi:hypothetical protein